MLFTQIECIIFLAGLVAVLALVKGPGARKYIILAASLYFYAYSDYRMLLLLLSSTLGTWWIGKGIVNCSGGTRRALLFGGVMLNLAVLGIFKYLGFFVTSFAALLGQDDLPFRGLGLILPLGISFYTFRFISYLVDISRGEVESPALLDFLVYGTFFPVIVAGPISRATTFLPQLERLEITADTLYNGFRLFVIGLFLKVFVADRVADYVNFFYANHELFNTATTWLVVLTYSVQIYCDFAGYSSMAIGAALMLGIRIEENFNFPYLAGSITEFWRRWHITLSTWIRDYLYIPLGGSKKGKGRKYVNLLLAMTLCGLWHGAAITFVFWGFLHGLFLMINHCWKEIAGGGKSTQPPSKLSAFAGWLLTYISVTLAWVFFRAENFSQAISIIKKMVVYGSEGVAWYHPFAVFILAATVAVHILARFECRFAMLTTENKITLTILFCLLWLVVLFHPAEFQPFVYNQF